MFRPRCIYNVKGVEKTAVLLHRGGSNTLQLGLITRWKPLQVSDKPTFPIVTMRREPRDRTESSFLLRRSSSPYDGSFETFVLGLNSETFTDVSAPQVAILPSEDCAKEIAWDFEAFAKEFNLPLPLPCKAQSTARQYYKLDWTTEMLEHHRRVYKDDYEMWERINGT